MRAALAALLAASLAASGCSVFSTAPPPNRPLVALDECTTNRRGPAADLTGALAAGGLATLLLGVAALQDENNQRATVPSWDPHPLKVDTSLIVAGVVSAVGTAAYSASATYGYANTRACAVARAELIGRTPPGQWPPGGNIDPP